MFKAHLLRNEVPAYYFCGCDYHNFDNLSAFL